MKRPINEPVSDQLIMVFTITNLFIGWQSTKKTLKRQLAPLRLVKGQCASGRRVLNSDSVIMFEPLSWTQVRRALKWEVWHLLFMLSVSLLDSHWLSYF